MTHLALVFGFGSRMRLTDGGILRPMTSRKIRSMGVSLRRVHERISLLSRS